MALDMSGAEPAAVGCGDVPWFVALPDRAESAATRRQIAPYACRTVAHASGRVWLMGCWSDGDALVAETGPARLAVFGPCALTASQVRERAVRLRTADEAESAVRGVAGSYHLLASVGGEVYARGSVSAAKRLYRATGPGGGQVLADRSRTLAWLIGAELDTRHVATRLATHVAPPYPSDQAALFRGVRNVTPGSAVLVDRSGAATTRIWWQPPEPELPLAEAAEWLRQALREATAARVRTPGEVWGADLSGGMDSTSLCFLAAEAGARLVAVTMDIQGTGGEDVTYARAAAVDLPPATTHLTFTRADLPPYLTGFDTLGSPDDEPMPVMRDLAQQHRIRALLAEHGAHRRLCGQGGDHVVIPPLNHLHDLVARQPARALRHLAGYRAQRRWGRLATLRALADRRSFASWLRREAAGVAGRGQSNRELDTALSWGFPASVPSWGTAHARELVADLLRDAADHAPPLAPSRGTHALLFQGQQAGRICATYEHYGMGLEMPFCDDAVLDACLRVRPAEATSPWTYKPLLATAMRGIVPDALLDRTTKDHATNNWHIGMREHQRQLARWSEDSHLVAAGLAEPAALRRVLLSPGILPPEEIPAVESTLGVEAWLRDLADHPRPRYLKEHLSESSAVR